MLRKYYALTNVLTKRNRSASTILNETSVPRKDDVEHIKFQGDNVNAHNFYGIREYDEVPGPKAIPILGNSWRFLPIIGE